MCGPAAIGLGIMAASALATGVMQHQAAKAEAAQYNYQADQQEEDAKVAQYDIRRQRDAAIARKMAEFAAGGGGVDSGLRAYSDLTREYEYEAQQAGTQAKRNATSLRLSAANATQSGKNSLISAGLGAASSVARNRMAAGSRYGSF